MKKFSAKIYKIGINPVVDPPEDILAAIFEHAGKSKGPIPVCGRLNGTEFIQTLVKYRGAWRLYVNGEMLKASKSKVSDTAEVEIEYDPRPRETPVPAKLDEILRTDRLAKARFEQLTPSRRKEILRYLSSLKTAESLDRNIERILKNLRGEMSEKIDVVPRRPTEPKQKRTAAKGRSE